MIKTVITAPRGHMDGLIAEEAWKNKELKIVGCVGTPGRDYIGKDICHAVSGIKEETGVLVYDDIDDMETRFVPGTVTNFETGFGCIDTLMFKESVGYVLG